MEKNTTTATGTNDTLRWIMVIALVVVAFFGAYKFASARSGRPVAAKAPNSVVTDAGGAVLGQAGGAADPTAAAGGSGCACCGSGAPTAGGVTGSPVEGTAAIAGDLQKISVDVTTVYNPNTIILKAGVPAEITFSQAQGCTQIVQSKDLGFSEDLGTGPKTVKLKGLAPGTYSFECGMSMVSGKIVVQ